MRRDTSGSHTAGTPLDTTRTEPRRRRPSGEPPPLPRELGRSGQVWLALAVAMAAFVLLVVVWEPTATTAARGESAFLGALTELRTNWATSAMRLVAYVGSPWTLRILRWGTIVALIGFRRWRHLTTFLVTLLAVELGSYGLMLGRLRPLGVVALGGWQGFAMPSRPLAGLAATLTGMAACLIPAGRPRVRAELIAAGTLVALAASRLYLAVDRPSDALVGVVLGVSVPLLAFRWFTPDDVVPVSYRRGRTAHLDVGGRRGEAIRQAVSDQLGLTVLDMKPVGLQGSGGSTPLRLRVAGEDRAPHHVFAKLYAQNHLRADSMYKMGRTILYGALEDETPFHSVHRLSEYEDYALRLLRDSGIPSAAPLGVVMITPGRECLLVTEFIHGAKEIGDADVDMEVIDHALAIVRKLWDAGLAHRDIKPANILVRGHEVFLIDAFFLEVRPSAWREAVDLGNMMLTLALRSDAARVHARALRQFSEDEIAEALAATHGVAIPTQLRTALKREPRDLLSELRHLAPSRAPVVVQRWSLRRAAMTLIGLTGAGVVIGVLVDNWNVFA